MQQAIAFAAAAGLASAFMFGAMAPGAALLAPLILVAPAPLLFVGLGWHPLVAALGALFGAIAISFALNSATALSFAVLIGLPSWLIAWGVTRLMGSMPPQTPANQAGRVFAIYVLGGIALYAALAMLVGALAVSFDYPTYEGQLLALFQKLVGDAGQGSGATVDTTTSKAMARMFVRALVPLSGIIIALGLVVSLWLAVRALARSERLPFANLPASAINLPKETVFWFAGALGLAQVSGFIGLFGATFAGTLLLVLLLNGLAMIHVRTRDLSIRALVLWAVWLSLLFFAPAALFYSFIGLLDSLFDLRRQGDTQPPI